MCRTDTNNLVIVFACATFCIVCCALVDIHIELVAQLEIEREAKFIVSDSESILLSLLEKLGQTEYV